MQGGRNVLAGWSASAPYTTLYSTVFTLHCTVYSTVHCLFRYHRTKPHSTVHCVLYTVHCTLFTVHYTLCTVHCAPYKGRQSPSAPAVRLMELLMTRPVHCTVLYCTALHCTALHCPLHSGFQGSRNMLLASAAPVFVVAKLSKL
jgi:hypothetical protein